MLIYLHNPKCSKSREGLKIMKDSKRNFTLSAYLKNPLDFWDLQELQKKLGKKAIEFTRVDEPEFTQQGLNKNSSDEQILKKMAHFPNLMQRPILLSDDDAVLGRPPENIKILL